jgi:excisionase family DNA binding protein
MNHRRAPSEPVPWRTSEQAAAYLGVGEKELRAMVRRREIAVIDGPGPRRFLARDLDAWLEHQRQPAAWERVTAGRGNGKVVNLPTSGKNPVTGEDWTPAAPGSQQQQAGGAR